ncbi:hypothetical protein EMIHUDRAFT_195492 [Emiliania huxleyi CCMP1516]|uniref:Uncharacterized protein n=2 Tax=Emiliania huxleyi TaxID=2903 RepID=A0A0D3JHK6_EMIH1|nr:hypothetical protein EMIHUDRAFT_195492 [Emiliania huxleyi CCMP1516]EOD22991.1 hypothetical protein EMIHUDRAFT_195492 [Emiliania huxleyi CCMP1516]|eukprot:XP_005775420.1 hypothetical protein EMIHUDRAFT_195492 [Emiliania huxleyi CCMP1516]
MTIRIPQLLVLLACSSAAALTLTQEKHLAKPNVRSLTRLRGGDTIGTAVVGASAAIGAATGVSMYLGTESITKMIWLGLNTFPHDKYIAVAMIGWAVGKLSAVMGGVEAAKRFASLNCIPLTLWLLTNFRGGAPFTTSIMPAVLLAGYVYAGFIED